MILDSEPHTGQESLQLCGGMDRPGTYTITATLEWYDSSYNKHVEPSTVVPFTLKPAATRTQLRASTTAPAYNSKIVFSTKSLIQGRLAYGRLDYEKVRLEAYRQGAWRKIDTTTTDGDGLAKFRYRWNTRNARVKVRAVTLGSAEWSLSTSRTLTIRVR